MPHFRALYASRIADIKEQCLRHPRHVCATREREEQDDGLICREAYTPASARSVQLHFVNDCGSAQSTADASDDGKLVYAFKKPPARSGS